jgi:hypothetical protein
MSYATPIERMVSEYHVKVIRGWEDGASSDQAALVSPDIGCKSRYALQAERYLEHFRPDHLLIIKSA